MDPRRFLILAAAGLALSGCATLSKLGLRAPSPAGPAATRAVSPETAAATTPAAPGASGVIPAAADVADRPRPRAPAAMAPIPNPPSRAARPRPAHRGGAASHGEPSSHATMTQDAAGPPAIAAANAQARARSTSRAFLGGVQVFAYAPGRVYEVWTAPLRVTTLTLSPGETVVSKAAGDTVRWQIGETESGEGPSRQAHVMIKPLQQGLETNLVLATNRRVYLIQLRSGPPDGFNAAVTWDLGALLAEAAPEDDRAAAPQTAASPGLVAPQGPLDAGFRIKAKGHRPAWTPTAVMTDGVRTFLTFPPTLPAGEAPALFAVSPGGEAQVVNYRQQGGLWIVDRVLDAAELRVGGKRAAVVRIERTGAAS